MHIDMIWRAYAKSTKDMVKLTVRKHNQQLLYCVTCMLQSFQAHKSAPISHVLIQKWAFLYNNFNVLNKDQRPKLLISSNSKFPKQVCKAMVSTK